MLASLIGAAGGAAAKAAASEAGKAGARNVIARVRDLWRAPGELKHAQERIQQLEEQLQRAEEKAAAIEARVRQGAVLTHQASEAVRAAWAAIHFEDFATPEHRELRGHDLIRAFQPLLGALARHFQEHFTKQPTAACIKMLIPRPDGPSVMTLVRDQVSEQHRGNDPYPVRDCTAFEKIMRENLHVFRPAEDLRVLEDRGEYHNPTREYWRHYRSTMVLPIRARRQKGAGTEFVFAGFLCLDCKEPGGFGEPFARQPRHEDNPEDFNVAATIADALFWPLVWFSLRLHRPEMAPIPYLEEALRLEQIEHIEKEGGAK